LRRTDSVTSLFFYGSFIYLRPDNQGYLHIPLMRGALCECLNSTIWLRENFKRMHLLIHSYNTGVRSPARTGILSITITSRPVPYSRFQRFFPWE